MSEYKLPPLQDPKEFSEFLKVLRDENVKSYLEIGSMYGRSLWSVAMSLPKGSLVVGVDSMVDRPEAEQSLNDCIKDLRSLGYDAHFLCGDSIDSMTVERARCFCPFDALFIDGNHSPEYVRSDWENYGPMARIVGFHDINWKNTWISARGNTPPPDGSKMGAPKIWNELKQGLRCREFKYYPTQNYYGIGVLWNE
jgi:hypothetical protein